jgi:uncharacterized protein DUF4339
MQKHQVAGEAGPRAPSWYLARGDKRYGPLADRELLLLAERGGLRTDDLLWKPGFSAWKPVHAVCDLKTSTEVTSRKVALTQKASPQSCRPRTHLIFPTACQATRQGKRTWSEP